MGINIFTARRSAASGRSIFFAYKLTGALPNGYHDRCYASPGKFSTRLLGNSVTPDMLIIKILEIMGIREIHTKY